MKFELRGGEEALRNLRMIGEAITDKNLQSDAVEAVQPIVRDAQSLAPVRTGRLRDSIGPMIMDDGNVAVVINDFRGVFFELGTVKMRAQPMLGPAADANEGLVIEMFGEMVGARIEGRGSSSRSTAALFEIS